MALKTAKQLLRKEIKKRIAALSEEEKTRQSQIVTNQLLSLPEYQSSKRISVFLNMSDEVKTEGIVKNIFESGKVCFIPKYVGPKMDMVRLTSWADYDALPITSWNIKQPADDDVREDALASGGLDLILMPGLGFSKQGDRLGRGRGYYDTYLEKCKVSMGHMPHTIALAYYEQICDTIPTSDHDVQLEKVLFEDKDIS